MKKKKVFYIILIIVIGFLLFCVAVYYGAKQLRAMWANQKEILYNSELMKDIPELEAELQDSDYYDSIETALLMSDETKGLDYTKHIDQLIFQNETEDYVSIYYISEKDLTYCSRNSVKFKKKEFDGITKYAYLKQMSGGEVKKDAPIIGTLEELLPIMFLKSDLWNHVMNANSDETRMLFGSTPDERIFNLKVEGLEPTEIICYDYFGETTYFFYYEDMPSTKSAEDLEFTLE